MLQKFFVLVILLMPTLLNAQGLLRHGVCGFRYFGGYGDIDTINTGMIQKELNVPDSVIEFSYQGEPWLNGSNELFIQCSFGKEQLRQEFPWPDSISLWVNIIDTLNIWFLYISITIVDTTGAGNITSAFSVVPITYGWQKVYFRVGFDHETVSMLGVNFVSFARTNTLTKAIIQLNDMEFRKEDGGVILAEPFQYLWPTAVESIPNLILSYFVLEQNYPNPFNPGTTIRYEIPEFSSVKLTVYNLLGEEVAELINSEQPAGVYDVDFDASGLSSGTYIYVLQTGTYRLERKMIVLK